MKKINGLTLTLAISLFSSCSHYYYVANVQNVPILSEKNEFHLSGFFGFGDESSNFELQTAYSLTDRIGIIADFQKAWGGNISEKDYARGTYFDAAIGYYKPMEKNLVFEFFGGAGAGIQHHEYSGYDYYNQYGQYNGSADLSSVKIFIQPSLGFKSDFFECAVSTRICRLSYTSIDKYIMGDTFIVDELNSIGGKSHYLIEPAFTLRGGGNNVKAQVQVLYSGNINSPRLYFMEELHLSVGLQISIPSRVKD